MSSNGVPAPPTRAALRQRDAFLIALTFASGVIDAASYLGLGHIFTANMTGNTVFLAIAAGQRDLLTAVRSAVALLGFAVGALVGGRHLGTEKDGSPWPHRATHLVWTELAFLVGFAVLWVLVAGAPDGTEALALISLGSVGMGFQSSVGRKLAVPGVTTNVLTMAFTGLMAELAAFGISGPNEKRWTVAIVSLASGAALGGLLFEADRAMLVLPLVAAVGLVCAAATIHDRRRAGTPST